MPSLAVKLPKRISGAPCLVQLALVLIKPSQSTDQTMVTTTLHLHWAAKTALNYIGSPLVKRKDEKTFKGLVC